MWRVRWLFFLMRCVVWRCGRAMHRARLCCRVWWCGVLVWRVLVCRGAALCVVGGLCECDVWCAW